MGDLIYMLFYIQFPTDLRLLLKLDIPTIFSSNMSSPFIWVYFSSSESFFTHMVLALSLALNINITCHMTTILS